MAGQNVVWKGGMSIRRGFSLLYCIPVAECDGLEIAVLV